MRSRILLALALAALPSMALASETVTYSYDAKGRLTQVAHSGSTNNGVVANYTFDKADNRTALTVSGSAFNGPASRIIVIPLNGLTVLPLPQP